MKVQAEFINPESLKKSVLFPKKVFVTVQNEGTDDQYLAVEETPDTAEDGQSVAVYELRDIRTKRVTHQLD
jgi:hypothetical protein